MQEYQYVSRAGTRLPATIHQNSLESGHGVGIRLLFQSKEQTLMQLHSLWYAIIGVHDNFTLKGGIKRYVLSSIQDTSEPKNKLLMGTDIKGIGFLPGDRQLHYVYIMHIYMYIKSCLECPLLGRKAAYKLNNKYSCTCVPCYPLGVLFRNFPCIKNPSIKKTMENQV